MVKLKQFAGIVGMCLVLICLYHLQIKEKSDGVSLHPPMHKEQRSEMQYDKNVRKVSKPNAVKEVPDGRCDGCFKWRANKTIISPPKAFCQNGGKAIDLLIIYISSPKNGNRRELLRQIYTDDLDEGTKGLIRVLFTFGLLEGSDQALVQSESERHGDVLEFDSRDSYYTMYTLHVNSLHWAYSECANLKFTVKMVDDAFLNIVGVLALLDRYGSTQLKDVVFGKCIYGEMPIRRSHKWSVSIKDYPYPRYPGLCGGGGIFMSLETGKALLNETSNVRYVTRLDDLDIGVNALLAKRCICNISGFHLGYTGSKAILKKLNPNLPVNCKIFPLKPFLGLHMFNIKADSWIKYVWQHRRCYERSIPVNIDCPSWGNCPDHTYPLPRG